MNTVYTIALLTCSAYLLGSISSAILISKIKNLPDPRSYDSGNPGASNILRNQGFKIGLIVIICDFLKGLIPIWIAKTLHVPYLGLEIIAIASCLGHIYPIFFRFCGGKGVAISLGTLTVININIVLIAISIWGITVIISRYSSLGTIITFIITPLYTWWIYPEFTSLATILSLLILFKHYTNIIRLYKHQEKHLWKF